MLRVVIRTPRILALPSGGAGVLSRREGSAGNIGAWMMGKRRRCVKAEACGDRFLREEEEAP